MDGDDHDGRIEGEAEVRRELGPVRQIGAQRRVEAGRPDDVDARGILAQRHDPSGVLLVAHEVEVTQLRDRVAQGIVEGPRVCSPRCRWMSGTRSRVAASAAAVVSSRSPASSSASGGSARSSAPMRSSVAEAWLAAAAVGVPPRPSSQRRDEVIGLEAIGPDAIDRVAVPVGEVHPADDQPQLEVRVGADGCGRRSAGCPSPGVRS